MKKTSNIKRNLKATVTTVTTAGILLTSITPSFAAEQQENIGEQIAPIQEQQNQTPDELKGGEVKQSNVQMNARTADTKSDSIVDNFIIPGNVEVGIANNVVLTRSKPNLLGAITKKTSLDLNEDFYIKGYVITGTILDGGEGLAMAFHTGKSGSLGKGGGGLGVLGLPNGVAFEIDTYTGGPEDNDPSFNHNQIKTRHAGFVSTSKSDQYLVALAPMQIINPPLEHGITLTMNWDAADKKLTVDYDGKHWELINPPFDYTQKYNFTIAATTGAKYNQQEFGLYNMTIRSKKPTVNEVTDLDTKVTGTATAGSNITVKVGANELGTSQADENGEYSIAIPKQAGGTKLAVTASNSAGTSQEVEITVKETAPTAPEVNEVTDQDTKVSGKAKVNSTVTVSLNDGSKKEGKADGNGNFSIDIPKQAGGTNLAVTASNSAGTSAATEITVKETAPTAPEVNEVTDQDTKVSGKATAGSKVTVKVGANELGTSQADETGAYSIDIPKQAGGTKLAVTASNSAGTSAAKEITVKETAPTAPEVNEVTDQDTKVSGKAKAGSKVAVKVGANELGTNTADETGAYSIDIPKQAGGTKLAVTASNSAGTSAATEITVKESIQSPTISEYYTTDAFAKGNAPGASKVAIYVDGKLVRTAAVEADGTYRIYTGDILTLQKEGAVFEVAARDAKGVESTKTKGTVLGNPVQAPTISGYYTTDAFAKGNAPGASKVAVYVDGKLVRTAAVEADGTYKIYTGDIPTLQKEGSVFEIAARNAAGKESEKAKGTVVKLHVNITANEYHLGIDSFITGTSDSTVTKVKVLVDDTILRQTATSNGAYSIYAKDVVKDANQKVEIAGFNSMNQEVTRTKVPVK